jgi:acid phosphatase type 7
MKKQKYLLSLAAVFCAAAVFCLQAWAGQIAIFGDSQRNEEAQQRVVKTILQYKPSVVFRTGDLVDDGRDPAHWKTFREINAPLLKSSEYYPALGNHEYESPLYFKEFPWIHGKYWYSVDYEGVHFIVLDSNASLKKGSDQYKWLLSDLKSVKKEIKFKIVLFHHPIFNVGNRHSPDTKKLKDILLPLFEKYKVAAVFSGHDHDYQRFEYHGIYFIVTGGGGAGLEDQEGASPYLKKIYKAYHFCLLSPGDNSLHVRVIDVDSRVIDEFVVSLKGGK